MEPKLKVTINGATKDFPLSIDADAVSVGSEMVDGLTMNDTAFNCLLSFVGDAIYAEMPVYLYNEGNMTSGNFENDNGGIVGNWQIVGI